MGLDFYFDCFFVGASVLSFFWRYFLVVVWFAAVWGFGFGELSMSFCLCCLTMSSLLEGVSSRVVSRVW